MPHIYCNLLHSRSAKTALRLTLQHAQRSPPLSARHCASHQRPAHQGRFTAPRRRDRRPRRRPGRRRGVGRRGPQPVDLAEGELRDLRRHEGRRVGVSAAPRRRRVAARARVPPHGRESPRGLPVHRRRVLPGSHPELRGLRRAEGADPGLDRSPRGPGHQVQRHFAVGRCGALPRERRDVVFLHRRNSQDVRLHRQEGPLEAGCRDPEIDGRDDAVHGCLPGRVGGRQGTARGLRHHRGAHLRARRHLRLPRRSGRLQQAPAGLARAVRRARDLASGRRARPGRRRHHGHRRAGPRHSRRPHPRPLAAPAGAHRRRAGCVHGAGGAAGAGRPGRAHRERHDLAGRTSRLGGAAARGSADYIFLNETTTTIT